MKNIKNLKIEFVKPDEINLNPNNPRIIKNIKYKKLVKSIAEFPEMLEARPIVVDESGIVLGGNMRLKAARECNLEQIPIIRFTGLTAEQKKEFVIKDNASFGDWDWNILQYEWDITSLTDWGIDFNIFEHENFTDDTDSGENNNEIVDIKDVVDFQESVNLIIKCKNLKEMEILQQKLDIGDKMKLNFEQFIKKIDALK